MTLFWMHLRKDIKKMTKIIFATGNAGKMREIRDIMADLDAELLSMKEAGIKLDIVEDGKTFEENALIKARAVSKEAPGAIVMADDSGLEVDYLHKKPGIYSARFIGEDISYDIKNQAILDLLAGVPKEKRTARFVCSIAAVLPDGREFVTRETMEVKVKLHMNLMVQRDLVMIQFFAWKNTDVQPQNFRKNRKMRSVTGEKHCVP
mgnify:CR=1 FL=1